MRLSFRGQKSRALARFDVLVALLLAFLLLTILLSMVLPVNEAARRRADQVNCVSNLKQINLAFRIWEGDNRQNYTALICETNKNIKGLNSGQQAWLNVMGTSNILGSEKILECPADKETPITTNALGLKIRISYFLNLDANEDYPQMLLAGDDNLVLGKPGEVEPVEGFAGPAVKPGILLFSTNIRFSWTRERHGGVGNIALADGSVEMQSPSGLQDAATYSLSGTPSSTNRLAIP